MEEVIRFYENQVTGYTDTRERLKKKIYRSGTARLILVAGALITLWLCRDAGWMICSGVGAAFAVPFIGLMMAHSRLSARKVYAEAMIQLNRNELKGLAYDFSAFDGAPEQMDSQHSFSLDLDLFGEQSLFQSINRTVMETGKTCLANWFTQPLTDKAEILDRQQAVRELAAKTFFRQHFYVTGLSPDSDKADMQQLQTLTGRYRNYFSNRPLWRILIWLTPAVWLAVAAGTVWLGVPSGLAGLMFGVSFLVANLPGKHIHHLYKSVNKMERVLSTYAQLMERVEKESFRSELLTAMQQSLVSPEGRASQSVKQLSRIIGALDQRYSLAGILLNLFYLRDVRQAMRLEQWLHVHARTFGVWFEALAQMDAMCSLGGFAFNHPGYAYPAIADAYFRMEGRALGHPLLNREHCVRNDLSITKNPYFMVITGANMAGKSTYLRTVGVNFLLACVGLPVCAGSLTVYPAQLVTSLRTADSLTANESYFFAELKRLKMIIDRLNTGEALFIILDEVLKGTNSTDKQKGSLALMRQLIAQKTCGMIATHDLLLGTLAQEFPEEVRNYCFEAGISGDTLTFTYQIREGVAQNMNASFLMKKMGITL
jgi:hypothetical protein